MPPDPLLWQARQAARALAPDEAYALARLAHRKRAPQTETGYRLYLFSDRLQVSIDLHDAEGGFAVIGRHSSCDVVLNEDLGVSLRHVLVRATALDDGFPMLRVLDLQTATGFELSDGSRQRSIAATGPVVFRIGAHSIVALPSSGVLPEDLPVAFVEKHEVAPRRAAAELRLVKLSDRPLRESHITLLPKLLDLSQRESIMPTSAEAFEAATGDGYEIVLGGRSLRAGVELSKDDLERGVIIGQSDKCVDARLRSVFVPSISRVHVLLLREAERNVLYDVASLNGTFSDHHRTRSIALQDSGTSVMLAGRSGIFLTFRAR